MGRKITLKFLIFISILFPAITTYAQEEKDKHARLGSADQTENREAIDDSVKYSIWDFHFLDPYFKLKDSIYEKTGIRFDFDYNTLYIGSTSDMGDGMAAGGVFRFYGVWDLVNKGKKNSGTFIYKLEHRHKYTPISVLDLSMDMGNVGIYGVTFNDKKFRVTHLYWKQKLFNGNLILLGGFFDATDFFDIYGLGSPWVHFNNLNFSTGLAVAALPGDGYLGFTAGGWLGDHIYVIAGFGDQNSDPTMIFRGFDTFISRHEYFKHFEIGATTAKEYVFLDNVHLSLWHRDNNSEIGTGWGWGAVFSISKYLNKKWLPFLRAAYTEKGETLLEAAVSTGIGYQSRPDGGQLGLGLSWGRPNADTFGPGLRDQYAAEAFWRIQLSRRLAFTPGLMYIINPAMNQLQDEIFLWSIRARIAL